MKLFGKIAFAVLLWGFAVGNPARLWAQITAGFTQVGSVAFGTNTFIDTTVASGTVYQYEVLSQNAAGVSVPSNIVTTPVIPSGAGSHSATLTWTPPATGAQPVTYVVARITVTIPNPPVVSSTITVAQNKAPSAPAATDNQVARANLKILTIH